MLLEALRQNGTQYNTPVLHTSGGSTYRQAGNCAIVCPPFQSLIQLYPVLQHQQRIISIPTTTASNKGCARQTRLLPLTVKGL